MKKLLLILLITVRAFAQIQPEQPSQGLFNGNIFANGYANWSVPMGLNASYSWTAISFCTANSGGTSFPAFTVGTPITILDQNNPQLNEVVTVTQVNIFATGCSISTTPPAHQHSAFSLTTATAGLQEAINANLSTSVPTTVHLTADWYKAGGNLTMVTATAKGTTNIGIIDDTTTPTNAYSWNGSHYVLTAIAGVTLATYNVPGLQGGGRCFVYPSMITTDAFALINSCSAQLPAAGGLIDATALGTANYTITTQLTALNNANQAVVLLLNPGTTFTINTSFTSPTNSPASCAVPVGPASQPNGGSAIIVPGKNSFGGSNFVLGPSARVWDAVCNGNFTGDQESLKLDGVYVEGNQSATMSGALMHLAGVFTPTSVVNSGTIECFGQCLELDAGTTGSGGSSIGNLLFENDLFQDSYSGSATYPGSVVNINTLTSQGQTSNINFVGGMIQLNGPHNPLLTINGHGGYQADSIGFFGTTFQGAPATTSGANPNVDPIQLTDVSSVLITNLRFRGATSIASQPNLVDINGTVQNAQFGINIDQPTAFTGAFTCLIKNNVEGTCETGYPNGIGVQALPNYTFGQFFPQVRQTNVAPPTTPGQCVVGSLWTNSSATTPAQTTLQCAGTSGNQVYVSFGGGTGGALGTLQNDLVGNNAGNTGAVDLYNFFAGSSFTPQQATNAASVNNGSATIEGPAGRAPFTNFGNVRVTDNRKDVPATARNVTEFGATCSTRSVYGTLTSASNVVTIINGFSALFSAADIGKTLVAVGSVSGIPTAFETTIASITDSNHAVMTVNAPFSQATSHQMDVGFDDTAAIAQGMTAVGAGGTLVFPSGNCLTHSQTLAGQSPIGLGANSQIVGFPGEDIFQAPDPSQTTGVGQGTAHIHDLTLFVDGRIDATLPWQIINNSGTTSKGALYRPIAQKSGVSSNPAAPGWFQGAGPNLSGAINGVCAINSGSPTLCTVPAGVTLPAATNTIVFPYLSSVFTTTVNSVNTGTRVVTLAGSYPGSTGSQIEWFAGTSVQNLSTSIGSGSCPATITLTNSINPAPGFESNVAPFGLIQIDAEQFFYFGKSDANNPSPANTLYGVQCAQNGTSRAAHSASATVVPLNQYKPAYPWPVTPTINAGDTTPAGTASYYPGWNVGNAGFSFPIQTGINAGTGSTGAWGANSRIENLSFIPWPVDINGANWQEVNHTAMIYFAQPSYATTFSNLLGLFLFYGIAGGPPSIENGNWGTAAPTADGTHWDGLQIWASNPVNIPLGNQNSYSNFNVYSQERTTSGTALGSDTCWYMTAIWDDQTGGIVEANSLDHFKNIYCEPEVGSHGDKMPLWEWDTFNSEIEDQHMGGGGEVYIGGDQQHWVGGNFNNSPSLPTLVFGPQNTADYSVNLGSEPKGNTYGTNSLINFNFGNNFSGTTSQAFGSPGGPYGALQSGNTRETIPSQTNETFNRGNILSVGYVSSDGGYITPEEFNSQVSLEAQAMTSGWTYDATSPRTHSYAACAVGNTSTTTYCSTFKFNGQQISIGPEQRLTPGKYTLYLSLKDAVTGSNTERVIVSSNCGSVSNTYNIAITNAWTVPFSTQIDLSAATGSGCYIQFGFNGATTADTVQIGYADFAPVDYQPTDYNLSLLNQIIDSTQSAGTSGFVWTSQGSGSPNHWAASAGGVSGGVSNTLPKFTGASTLGLSLWTDNGTTTTYSGTGGIAVTATTPGKWSLGAGTGSIPALASNSAGFAAPNTGGTAYLFKLPATITQGFLFAATPGTNDGVNESAITPKSIEFILDGDMSLYGGFASGTLIKSAKMTNAGHFTNLEVANTSSASCTGAPTINVYDLTASTSGTGLVASTTGTPSGTILDQAQTLAFSAGDQIAIKVQTIGSGCTSSEFAVTATVSEP